MIKIAFYLQISVHISFPQRNGGACHKRFQRDLFINLNGKYRISLANLVLLSFAFDQKRMFVEFLQKRNHSLFYYHFFTIPFIFKR